MFYSIRRPEETASDLFAIHGSSGIGKIGEDSHGELTNDADRVNVYGGIRKTPSSRPSCPEDRAMTPDELAVALHDDLQNSADVGPSPETGRIVDHWLHQIEHFDPIFASEYVEAPALLHRILTEAEGCDGWRALVREDEIFQGWGLCQHLLAEGERAAATSDLLAWELTSLGVEVAGRVDGALYHPAWTADLRAKAWCLMAEACWRLGRHDDAGDAIERARRYSGEGTRRGDLADRLARTERLLDRPPAEPRSTAREDGVHRDTKQP